MEKATKVVVFIDGKSCGKAFAEVQRSLDALEASQSFMECVERIEREIRAFAENKDFARLIDLIKNPPLLLPEIPTYGRVVPWSQLHPNKKSRKKRPNKKQNTKQRK